MQRPHYRLFRLLQIRKQKLHLQHKPMNIMKLNHIWVPLANPLNQSSRLPLGSKPMLSPKKRRQHMHAHIPSGPKPKRPHPLWRSLSPISNQPLIPIPLQSPVNIHHNPPHTPTPTYRTNLQNLQSHFSHLSNAPHTPPLYYYTYVRQALSAPLATPPILCYTIPHPIV